MMSNQSSQKKQPPKRMMLFCEPCGFKRIIEPQQEVKDLPEVKTSAIQLNLPALDPATQKTVPSKFSPQAKKYKCPKCGRAVKARELLKPYVQLLELQDVEKEKKRQEEEKKRRLEDGKPHEKKIDPDFMG